MTAIRTTAKSLFALGSGLAVLAPAAQAALALEEVIVTANRIETNLMETPAAITSFDSDMREKLGIENAADISARTPSLTIAPSRISIRGVGRPNIALGSDPGVGLYWDGVYNTENDVFGYSNFLDIDRVEVLRGPQGTLYGRNSIGGAINFVSKKPTEEWEGKVVAAYGNYDTYELQGLVSGPVTEALSILAAASKIERQEGFQQDVDSGDTYDKSESTYLTLGLLHQTTDRWTNNLKVFTRDGSTTPENPYVLEPFSTGFLQEVFDVDTGEQLNFPGTFPNQNFVNMQQGMTRENPAVADPNDVSIDREPYQDNERDALIFISEYEADAVVVKYTAGYSEFDFALDYDADGIRSVDSGLDWSQLNLGALPVSLLTGITRSPSDLTRPFFQQAEFESHELQFTSQLDGAVNFIGGLYYFNSDEKQGLSFIENNPDIVSVYQFFGGLINAPTSEDGFLFRGESALETKSYAVYGQATWDVSENTIVTGGLRYSYDEKAGSDNTFVQWVGDPDNPTVFRNTKDDWDQVTWRLGVDHFLADDHFVYASIATGYRSGGFNLMAPTSTTDVGTVDPEELLSYEVGYKGSLLDQRVNLSTSVYYYDYQDLQVLKNAVIEGVTLSVYENAAEAEAWGIESEVTALLAEGLTVNATWSYNETEYSDFDSIDTNACAIGPEREGRSSDPLCTVPRDLSGNSFPLSPENKFSVNMIYAWEAMNLEWRVAGSYIYTDEQYTTPFNLEELDVLDSWDRWDARVSVASTDETWDLTAFVKNIGDDREVILRDRPSTVTDARISDLTEPRTYGVRLTYNFR
ncbi:MAG: TonB-dependent receptor [Halioglobus sp.]